MAWHYRDCDLGHGAWQAKQLHVSLLQLSKRLPISVYAGDKVRTEGGVRGGRFSFFPSSPQQID